MTEKTSLAKALIAAIGRARLCAKIGVNDNAISMTLTRSDRLPTKWYPEVKALCDEDGIECPLEAFNWKSSQSQHPSGVAAE